MPNVVQPRYLNIAQASAYAGISVRTLRKLIRARRLPASKLSAVQQGHVRIRVDDLDALLASARV